MNKFSVLALVTLLFFAANCSKTQTATVTDYAQVCTVANKDKDVTVEGFLQVADKVPCMNMLNPKRDCAFKFADKINVVGKEIIVYLQEGAGSNETETPEAGKSAFQSKPTSVFTREQVKIRLDDGSLITPQADIATPVTVTGKVRTTDGDNICTISAAKIEKRQ